MIGQSTTTARSVQAVPSAKELQDIIAILGMDELGRGRQVSGSAQDPAPLSQPFSGRSHRQNGARR